MIENIVTVKLPKNRISYNEYRDWCIKVDFGYGWDPGFYLEQKKKGIVWYLSSAKLPEDLAILFRLEFNV